MEKTICELFAGVGGFRLGFERLKSDWKTVWFSQWEPLIKSQWAHDCYIQHFGDSPDINNEYHTNEDISLIDKNTIPDHTLLVGGFPCQDYSVAQTLSSSKGIEGKKGVLWWQIVEVIEAKRPYFCIFENVDRLLKSPAKQRGRDFGIILSCFTKLGYDVEWRVVNSASYGAAQRRKRTFIFAYRHGTVYRERGVTYKFHEEIIKNGFMAKAFPIREVRNYKSAAVSDDILYVSDNFEFDFENAGCCTDGLITTAKIVEKHEPIKTLGSILESNVDERFYIPKDKLKKWRYLKGKKQIERVSKTGFEYVFSEGAVPFPDPLTRPGRTMLTSEGTINRSSHVVRDPETNRLRILTPIETERLQGFDDDWTNTGMSDRMRYFCMGNALVIPMITRMGKILDEIISKEDQ